ncbi:SCO4402 family protein [Roseateles sp. L2-2]|uniref:SCO4402 family protein n=1 Tax=Roseateles sp. L2-2 TaxID=3422597 RepID=UPI003D36BB68
MSKLSSAEQRRELLGNLHALSDPIYQQRVWVQGLPLGSVQHDEFGYAVHFFFDDSTLKDDPHGNIGWMLVDANEARLVTAVIDAIDAILEKYGKRLKDSQYIALPEWVGVVEAARAALSIMSDRDQVP